LSEERGEKELSEGQKDVALVTLSLYKTRGSGGEMRMSVVTSVKKTATVLYKSNHKEN
jgi:hypothetical protein